MRENVSFFSGQKQCSTKHKHCGNICLPRLHENRHVLKHGAYGLFPLLSYLQVWKSRCKMQERRNQRGRASSVLSFTTLPPRQQPQLPTVLKPCRSGTFLLSKGGRGASLPLRNARCKQHARLHCHRRAGADKRIACGVPQGETGRPRHHPC